MEDVSPSPSRASHRLPQRGDHVGLARLARGTVLQAAGEVQKAYKYAIEKFASDMLAVADSLEKALAVPNATPDQLTQLSNNINTLLAKVVGVLNASNLTLAAGSLDALSPLIQH